MSKSTLGPFFVKSEVIKRFNSETGEPYDLHRIGIFENAEFSSEVCMFFKEDVKIAHLMATSPLMLDALEGFIKTIDQTKDPQFVENKTLIALQNIRAVIKQARGVNA